MRRVAMLVAAGLFLQNIVVVASEADDEESLPLWEMRGVAFGQNFPAYPGAGDQNITVLPLPYPLYRGKILRFGEDFDEIAQSRLFKNDRMKLDISFDATFPTDSKDIDVRTGMPDLDLLVEVGPELEIKLSENEQKKSKLLLNLQVRGVFSLDGLDPSGRGFVFNPELEYKVDEFLSPRNKLSLRWSPVWATENYMDFFYEVSPEFANPTRPVFDASSGYLTTELKVGFKRQLTDHLEFVGSARLWVNKSAENDISPLFQRDYGSGIRAALIWTFWTSKKRAGGEDE